MAQFFRGPADSGFCCLCKGFRAAEIRLCSAGGKTRRYIPSFGSDRLRYRWIPDPRRAFRRSFRPDSVLTPRLPFPRGNQRNGNGRPADRPCRQAARKQTGRFLFSTYSGFRSSIIPVLSRPDFELLPVRRTVKPDNQNRKSPATSTDCQRFSLGKTWKTAPCCLPDMGVARTLLLPLTGCHRC